MAGAARHLALAHRHVRHGALGLRHLEPVTRRAQLGLGGLHQLELRRLGLVHAVAGGAGEVAPVVRTAFPARVRPAIVAREAGLVDLGRLQGAELLDVPFRLVVHVRLARAVAALAAERRRRRARILGLPVPGMFDVAALFVVADHTRVSAGVPWSPWGLRRRRSGRWGRGCRRLRARRRLRRGRHHGHLRRAHQPGGGDTGEQYSSHEEKQRGSIHVRLRRRIVVRGQAGSRVIVAPPVSTLCAMAQKQPPWQGRPVMPENRNSQSPSVIPCNLRHDVVR